ncbi:AAA family ATPase [Clostridium sp.]|uniref:AAA family ATPase n=1 Tax=Clostridium sp. TaxID=1506 RepID=UPI001B45BB63|nr:AAA family ATPase [Clostridium sp.]MBP3916175.1 AAA family ATPase [Clostridium sp.]
MRILLALGHESLENYLKNTLSEHDFVGAVSYREGVIKNCVAFNPDIIVLRETLPGSASILDIVYELRNQCFNSRIIFISKERKIGDPLLSELVSLGVYDIIVSNPVKVTDIISLIEKPNSFSDVSYYRKKLVFDENSDEFSFTAPKQIIKKVYVEKSPNGELVEKEEEYVEEENNQSEEENPPSKKNDEIIMGEYTVDLRSEEEINSLAEDDDTEDEIKPKEQKKIAPARKKDKKTKTTSKVQEKNKVIRQGSLSYKTNIITFIGSNFGVGATQTSFNLAVELSKNYKTLYIECSQDDFSIYNIFYLSNVSNFEVFKDSTKITDSILTKDKLIKNTVDKNDIYKNYKLLPDKLHLMFMTLRDSMSYEGFKDMLINLTLQCNFDFIIFDIGNNTSGSISEFLMQTSSEIFIVTTQDFNYITLAEEINRKIFRLNSNAKVNMIVNKFENSINIGEGKIREFTTLKSILTIPYYKDILSYNFLGTPIMIKTKDKSYINSINHVINKILNELK